MKNEHFLLIKSSLIVYQDFHSMIIQINKKNLLKWNAILLLFKFTVVLCTPVLLPNF